MMLHSVSAPSLRHPHSYHLLFIQKFLFHPALFLSLCVSPSTGNVWVRCPWCWNTQTNNHQVWLLTFITFYKACRQVWSLCGTRAALVQVSIYISIYLCVCVFRLVLVLQCLRLTWAGVNFQMQYTATLKAEQKILWNVVKTALVSWTQPAWSTTVTPTTVTFIFFSPLFSPLLSR